MTLPLPPVEANDSVQFAIDKIAEQFPIQIQNLATGQFLQLATTGTRRKVAFGTQTLTWSASPFAAAVNITHGLGTTPAVVLLTTQVASGGAIVEAYVNGAPGATTFPLRAVTFDSSSITQTATAYWLAIG